MRCFMDNDNFNRTKWLIRRTLMKIAIAVIFFVAGFFVLYGAKKALGIDIFQNMTFWEFLMSLFS
jgi:hypothetical protein